MKNLAVILAAGSGERLPSPVPKQFLLIAGRSLLEICLERFRDHPGIDGIILVSPADRLAMAEKVVADGPFPKVIKVLAGGKTRQESSSIGIAAVPEDVENILIHDAARALVPPEVITRILEALSNSRAVMPVLPVNDTTIRVDDEGSVMAVLDRCKLRRVQTPQGFKLEIIRQAHARARAEGYSDAGDDCSLVLRFALAQVATVAGDPSNIKITYPQDLQIAEAILGGNR
jgi:ribitol-5-phosphate 2-dehydrogenase (NADP+) / D-ribitol-5-phosphate cytidylyltransferase